MKLIICGSRTITDYQRVKPLIEKGIEELKIKNKIDEIISGGAVGPDILGEQWAKENGIPVKRFIPDWKSLGKRAGMLRNMDMAEYANKFKGYLICIHDGVSRGALQCYNYSKDIGLNVIKYQIEATERKEYISKGL